MKLYYHQTDGGAEYYCLKPVRNSVVGDITTAILRTDGDEFELNMRKLAEAGVPVIIKIKGGEGE